MFYFIFLSQLQSLKKKTLKIKIIGVVGFRILPNIQSFSNLWFKSKGFGYFSILIDLDVIELKDINLFIFGFGRLAQLVEHLVYTEGVKGSSPLLPTKNQ